MAVPQKPPAAAKLLADRVIFRTTSIAELIGCSTHTVARWIDAGRLVGHRPPGMSDRRVRKADLVAFLRSEGLHRLLPDIGVHDPKRLAIAVGTDVPVPADWELLRLDYAPAIAEGVANDAVAVVFLDSSIGVACAAAFAGAVASKRLVNRPKVCYFAGAGGVTLAEATPFDRIIRDPVQRRQVWLFLQSVGKEFPLES